MWHHSCTSTAFACRTSPHALKVQQLLTNGPCFTITPKGFVTASHWLASKHAEYLRGDGVKGAKADQTAELICQSLRAGFGKAPHRVELFLVPVHAKSGKTGKVIPTFLGYLVHEGATLLADGFVRHTQLPVVLDLDETLLVANSLSQLESQMAKAKESRRQLAAEAATITSTEARAAIEERQGALSHEMQSLEEDRILLRQYRDTDTVVGRAGVAGQVERARYETAKLDDGTLQQRPVVRLPGGVVLTRIDPNNRDTSMIMRIRPGWEALRGFLAPELNKGPRPAKPWKRRFDVYVCTAAERGYALEAWRLLDSNNDIIPDNIRSVRVVCVPGGRKKELRHVFRTQAPITYRSEGAPAEAACAMPLAIIVDDRLDVWEIEAQVQVLQVAPFAPHRPNPLGVGQMGNTVVQKAMVDEMGLVKDRMIAIRAFLYHDVNKLLTPAVEKLVSLKAGQPLDLFATDVSKVLPSVPNLSIDDVMHETQAAAATGLATASSFGVNHAALRPQDPRQARRGPWPANQGQAHPGAPFAAALHPVDPRKGPTAPASNQPQAPTAGPTAHQQPTASAPPEAQAWRPSPSFRQQQPARPQQQQAAVPDARVLSHQLSNGNASSGQQPKDPRRARQQQQQQRLPQSSLGSSQQLPQSSLAPKQQQSQQVPQQAHQQAQQRVLQQVPWQPHQSSHGNAAQQQQVPEQAPRQVSQSSLGDAMQQRQQQLLLQMEGLGQGQQGMPGLQPARAGQGMQQTASGVPGLPPPLAAVAAREKALDLDLALPEIMHQMSRPAYNPISLIKEAADKQKVVHKFTDRTIPPGPEWHLPTFQCTVVWQGQEIASATEGDKKKAKKKAAQRAIDFLLEHSGPRQPVPTHDAAAMGNHPSIPQPFSSGTSAGLSEGQGTSEGQSLIKEDNALSMLQRAFPKEVKYANKPLNDGSGRFCEAVDCGAGHAVARGTTSTKQTSRRWAAMRLLQELSHTIDPAFFRDTPEGLRQRSKGPSQDEFRTATQVLYLEGRPFPQRRPSNRAQHAQQAQHTQQPQQAQHAQQEGDRRALQPQAGVGANTQPLLHLHTAQQQQQGRVNSPRGQKRFAPSEPVQALHPSKRGKHADEAGTIQQHDPHKHAMSQAGDTDIDDEDEDEQYADVDDHAKDGHDIEHDEDEVPGDDNQSPDDEMGDASMEDDEADEASNMSMDPPGQSGYPADPGDEEEEKYDQTPREQVDVTVSPEGRAARSEVISVSDGSSNDGSENVGAQSVEPEGSINMDTAGGTFLAAVKRQSKVKEGDWLEVRQQSNSDDYGVIDIG
ncbi:hypothetical protein ABBQ32_006698 [Trebouxia sp. C0010 RCD-2024]